MSFVSTHLTMHPLVLNFGNCPFGTCFEYLLLLQVYTHYKADSYLA